MNSNGTRENRLLRRLQSKYSYNLHPQWTDNFICEAALEGLWTSLCETASRLLAAGSAQDRDRAWRQFELEHWHRTRISVRGEHFKSGGKKKDLKNGKAEVDDFQDVSLVAITEEDEVNAPLL